MKEKLYLILDNQGSPLAQATLESPPGAEVAQMRLVQEMDMDVTGNWKGQRPIRGHDLSCGGVAFHSERELQPREIVQIVLPVTDEPMVLKTRILRPIPTDEPVPLYASQFVDLILDEEIMIRKAVFSIQVSHPRPAVNS